MNPPSDYYILVVLLNYHSLFIIHTMSLFCNRNHEFLVLKKHVSLSYSLQSRIVEEKNEIKCEKHVLWQHEVNCSWHNSQWQNQSGCVWKPCDWMLSSHVHSSLCYSFPASPEHWLRCSPDPSLQHPSWFHTCTGQ